MNQSSPVGTKDMGAAEIAILLWAAVVGTSFFTLAPVLVGALVDHMQLTVREVGVITSGELAGSALGSTLVLLYGLWRVAFERESHGMKSLYPPFGGYRGGGYPNRFESYNRRQLEWVHAAIRRRVTGAREGRGPYRARE